MKKIIITALICTMALAGQSQPATKTEKIKNLMDLTGSGNLGVQVLRNMIPSFQKVYPKVPKEFWDDFVKSVKPEDLVDLIVPAYDKYYTEQDIDQLIAFYNSPVGKKTISIMPMIMQDSMAAGQAWGRQLGEKAAQQLKEKGYTQ